MKARVPSGRTVVVIGGGISGLATAALLATEGHSVTVLENRFDLRLENGICTASRKLAGIGR